MPVPFEFDFRNPDYVKVFEWRRSQLMKIRRSPKLLSALKLYYRDNPGQFITDWGITIEHRNPEIGRPALIPFILVPKQEEWCAWLFERWKGREPGLVEKSRDMGLSWLAVGMSVALCLFNEGIHIGYGSRKEEYVDSIGSPKAFFHRVREFITHLPKEFIGDWDIKKHTKFRQVVFPNSDSFLSGEGGDNIGRGDRTSIYFVDEAAYLEHPEITDAALSQTTNCRVDISTPNGSNNPFARKRFGGKVSVFSFHWRDNPLKDQAWYDKKCAELDDPVIIARELDLDYSGSVDRVLIPSAWIESAIDAHVVLGIQPSGVKRAGLDVADEGKDKNAFCGRYGFLLEYIESFSGKDSDIYKTVEYVMRLCSFGDYSQVFYDADGLGAGVRGDAREINQKQKTKIEFRPFRGSGAVADPDRDALTDERVKPTEKNARRNIDFFANAKAQAWWRLARRFQLTHRVVTAHKENQPIEYDPDKIISISSKLKELPQLRVELSQPTYKENDSGKILIEKAPNGARSPNLADAVMIAYAPVKKPAQGFFDL